VGRKRGGKRKRVPVFSKKYEPHIKGKGPKTPFYGEVTDQLKVLFLLPKKEEGELQQSRGGASADARTNQDIK